MSTPQPPDPGAPAPHVLAGEPTPRDGAATSETAPAPRAPEEIFLEFLGRNEGQDVVDPAGVDALCRRHPSMEAELRDLAERWQLAAGLRDVALAQEADGTRSPPTRPPAIAGVLARLSAQAAPDARYRDGGELGRGAQGMVRRAFDATLQRQVAMKVPLDAGTPSRPGAPGSSRRLGRFVEEAQITAQLDHPAIVPVHDLGLDARGGLYFTMKLVSGRSLHDVLAARARSNAGEWTTTRLVGVLARVAEAMDFAHDRGVVHRDLKPANVMLGDYGEVYVMDWGLARVVGPGAGATTIPSAPAVGAPAPAPPALQVRTDRRHAARDAPESSLLSVEGDVVGTPPYMAPEQASGRLAGLGPAADVYALGAMLYHVLAGRPPYTVRSGASTEEMLDAVIHERPAPLEEVAQDVPVELAAICERAMERDPATRYASMKELAADLRAFLESRVVRAYERGPLAELRKWVRRNRGLAAAFAGATLAALGGLYLLSRVEAQGRERAEAAQHVADRRLEDVLRLSDIRDLDRLRNESATLWPADPDHVPALKAWIGAARALLDRLDAQRATLAGLRARAEAYTEDDARADRDDPKLAEELAAEEASVALLIPMLAAEDTRPDPDPARRRVILRKLADRRAAIDRVHALQAARRTWRFANASDAWWHANLSDLVAGLENLAKTTLPDVQHRLERAESLERISLVEAAADWTRAIASIADVDACPLYGGLRIAPQLGLVPLDRNPDTGLWEFWDVQLGDRPEKGDDGHYRMRPESGLLFVLVPGGACTVGAQRTDPAAPNYDPFHEVPIRTVRLDPYFIAAFETTQAQWERAMGRNPSLYYCPGNSCGNEYTETDPVESITWREAGTMAKRFGFALPTETQWEYACRAGTTTAWWTGNTVASLSGAGNFADVWLAEHTDQEWEHEPSLDDGHSAHAPVGSYRPNPFGLYDVIGNVFEWTRDPFVDVPTDAAPGDGGRSGGNPAQVPVRGGSFFSVPADCTSAHRTRVQSDSREAETGIRVVRALRGPAG